MQKYAMVVFLLVVIGAAAAAAIAFGLGGRETAARVLARLEDNAKPGRRVP